MSSSGFGLTVDTCADVASDEVTTLMTNLEFEEDERNWETDASDSSQNASSDHEIFIESCWKRDRRLLPVGHIPRLNHESTAVLHDKLTEKKEIKELLFWSTEDGDINERIRRKITFFFPIIKWGADYINNTNRSSILKSDIIAGITVGVMAIPQTMSYANIAGLEYVYGLYAVLVATLVYGICGNSRQLGVGPVAMVSLIVEAGLQGLLTEDECPEWYNNNPDGVAQYELCPNPYAKLAFLTSFWVGIFNIIAGLLNLGFLVNFLAHPIVSGFTSGAAIIIGLSQVKYIFGFKLEKSPYVHETISAIISNLPKTKPVVFILGILWIFGLAFISYATKKWKKISFLKPMGPLIMCTVGIMMCWIFQDLKEKHHVSIVGGIPDGFPPFSFINLDFGRTNDIMSTAIAASLIGYMESIAISKALASKNQYKIDANGEMVALGLTNFIGSMFSSYPVTGSFSRSAVNDSTGAQTQFAGLVTSFIIFLTLILLTPLFYYLPKFALAAIVINSVRNLVAWREAIHLFHVRKMDCTLWFIAFLGTLFLGIELGIGIAVIISLIMIIHETVRPQVSVLWRLPHTHVYASIKTTTHGSFVPGVLVVRVGNSVYFANCGYIEDLIFKYYEDYRSHDPLHYVVISLASCTSFDSSAIETFQKIHRDFARLKVRVCFASVGNRVWPVFDKSGLTDKVGIEWFHESCHDAVQHCLAYDNSHIDEEMHLNDNIETKKEALTVGSIAKKESLVGLLLSAEIERQVKESEEREVESSEVTFDNVVTRESQISNEIRDAAPIELHSLANDTSI